MCNEKYFKKVNRNKTKDNMYNSLVILNKYMLPQVLMCSMQIIFYFKCVFQNAAK